MELPPELLLDTNSLRLALYHTVSAPSAVCFLLLGTHPSNNTHLLVWTALCQQVQESNFDLTPMLRGSKDLSHFHSHPADIEYQYFFSNKAYSIWFRFSSLTHNVLCFVHQNNKLYNLITLHSTFECFQWEFILRYLLFSLDYLLLVVLNLLMLLLIITTFSYWKLEDLLDQ